MAAVLGFRIGIDASKFCTNIKRCFYIYVDLLRDRTVQDIESRIKLLLQTDKSISLFKGSFYLPPSENVRLLCPEDVLKVVEQCEDGLAINDCPNEVNENTEQILLKRKKKRKKNHVHINSVNDSNRMDIDKHYEAVNEPDEKEMIVLSSFCKQTEPYTLMTCDENEVKDNECLESIKIDDFNKNLPEENDLSFSSHKYMKKIIQEENGKVAGLNNDDVQPIQEENDKIIGLNNDDVQPIQEENDKIVGLNNDDVQPIQEENDKIVGLNNGDVQPIQEENDKIVGLNNGDVQPKKRHRTRARKHKKKQTPSKEYHRVPPITFEKKVCTPDTNISRTHIRFDEDSDDDKSVKLCISPDSFEIVLNSSITEPKSIFGNCQSTKWDIKNSSTNYIANGTSNGITNGISDSSETFAKLLSFGKSSTPLVFERKRNECEAISQQLQAGSENGEDIDIFKYPKLSSVPEVGDVIAFKMLKLDENYTPKISEYIMAKVLSMCQATFQLSLLILGGGDQCKKPKGKFHVEEAEDDDSSNDRLALNWNELYETRLLYP